MSLADKAVLVSLSISQWQARKLDRRVTEDVAYQHGVSTVSGRYNKVLLPGSLELAAVHAKTSMIRKEFYANTMGWGIEGTQLLPAKNMLHFRKWYNDNKNEWVRLVNNFVNVYPNLVTQAKHNLRNLFNEADYPHQSEIAGKFSIDLATLPVPDTDFRVAGGLLSDEELDELKEGLSKQLASAQENAMKEIWKRLYDRVETVANKLADPEGIFKDSLVHNTLGMCELVKRLNFNDDAKLEEVRERIEKTLGGCNPDALRLDRLYRDRTLQEARNIMETMHAYV